MFDNKQENSVDSAQNKQKNSWAYTENIFKELSWELDFWKNNDQEEVSPKKGKEYYLKLGTQVFGVLNVLFILSIIGVFLYTQVQNDDKYYSKSIIDPFCFLILWDLQSKNTGDYCSSVSALVVDYENKTTELKQEIGEKLTSIFMDLYILENFTSSKEVEFLIANKVNKLKVLDILNDFDRLKNDFSAGDKKLIDCSNIKLSSDNIINMTCDVYSSSWERVDVNNWIWIVGDTWDRKTDLIEGTSISTAASFLNFIEKNSQYNFQLLEKQKVFQSDVVSEGPYVRKTKIDLKMKYNNLKNNLSL